MKIFLNAIILDFFFCYQTIMSGSGIDNKKYSVGNSSLNKIFLDHLDQHLRNMKLNSLM